MKFHANSCATAEGGGMEDNMTKKTITVQNNSGLDARPIALLVQTATTYSSEIHIEMGTKKVNAKSIMGMMTLELVAGSEIVIEAEGEDEAEAVKGLEEFLLSEDQK